MPNYLLLLHQRTDRPIPATAEGRAAITQEYMAWADQLRAEGRHKAANKLTNDAGKHLTFTPGHVTVTDGPYAESKEVIGGYYIIGATDYAEACRVAEHSPHIKYGGRIEIREIHEL